MRLLTYLFLVSLISGAAFGNIPANSEYDLNHSGYIPQKVQLGTLVNKTQNLLIARYSFAIQGGSTTAPLYLFTSLTTPRSYAILPINAVVKNVYIDVLTAPTSGGSPLVAIRAQGTADLFTAFAASSMSLGRYSGVPLGSTVSTYVKMTADRKVVIDLTKSGGGAVSPLTAGKFNVIINYDVSD